ncbi:MAG: glutamate-cysteine ligase family protein [Candidatus Melainabacteria bacterium]|nr:glutamate-cysteine ligase family protein [Candidatus Melainabacteria bacterium]
MESQQNNFGFGIETEHCLLNDKDFSPLFQEDLRFEQLLELVDSIPVSDFSTDGFNIKPLHKKANPYLIEGYYLTDADMKPTKMLPKGIEIRTPIAATIDTTIANLKELTERLRCKLAQANMTIASISHHPTAHDFHAPPNYHRHDYWQWALTAMTTYGPDMNISIPNSLVDEIDREPLGEKINFYIPSLVALSFNSPLYDGGLWTENGIVGKSVRTFKRSAWAPLYYIHTEPALRFEFKGFEMAQNMDDYKAYFLCGLAMLLDKSLTGRASDAHRLERLRHLSVNGLSSQSEKERAALVLTSAEKIAQRFEMDGSSLKTLWSRLESGVTPADRVINTFKLNGSIKDTMRSIVVTPENSALIRPTSQTLCM